MSFAVESVHVRLVTTATRRTTTHRLDSGLELMVEELQAVVEDVLIGGVQAGLHTVSHHVGSSGRILQLQDLHQNTARKQSQM